jgi:hypothetical protein
MSTKGLLLELYSELAAGRRPLFASIPGFSQFQSWGPLQLRGKPHSLSPGLVKPLADEVSVPAKLERSLAGTGDDLDFFCSH